jgi:hypothetical protein
MLAVRLPTFVLLLIFSACGSDSDVPSESITEKQDPTANVSKADVKAAVLGNTKRQESAAQRLDLSRGGVERVLEAMDDVELGLDKDRILPELFDAEAEQEKMRLSGGVLTNKEAESLRDRIDGVELKIELTRP